MPNESQSLDAQAARWSDLNNSEHARRARQMAYELVLYGLAHGLHVEIAWKSHPLAPRRLHSIEVTPTRDAYQSTT